VTSPSNATTWLTGCIPDLPTPFDEADRLDLRAFERLCERQIAAGVTVLVVCETAGEASTLSAAERDMIIRAAVEITSGRARVIAGAGSNSTDRAIEFTRRAEAAGADAVLSVVPYYNKPMQSGIFAHFRAIAGSTGHSRGCVASYSAITRPTISSEVAMTVFLHVVAGGTWRASAASILARSAPVMRQQRCNSSRRSRAPCQNPARTPGRSMVSSR
jgi:dihydrodipicolinate synthase/N-acetylneuraminate lyase